MSLLRMLVKKKAKESLNSSEPDEQAPTRPTPSNQITPNEDPSTGFPSKEESGTNVDEAKQILKDSKMPISTAEDLDDAAGKAVTCLT